MCWPTNEANAFNQHRQELDGLDCSSVTAMARWLVGLSYIQLFSIDQWPGFLVFQLDLGAIDPAQFEGPKSVVSAFLSSSSSYTTKKIKLILTV